MYTYNYPRPALSVDMVVFTLLNDQLYILLIQRAQPPFQGSWALPGGFVGMEESLESAAHRELAEETGIEGCELDQFHTYGDPHRDPRGRVVSVAYCTYLPPETSISIREGGDAKQVRWYPMTDLPNLAFDHSKIIQDAFTRIREKFKANRNEYQD